MTDSIGSGLLEGYRVLDLTDERGVYCTKLLADLGADVVLVEPPSGHKGRHRGPYFHDEVHPEKSLYFLYFNTDKRSITLNLEHPDGRDLFKQLVKKVDVVVESFQPGYLKKLGLDYKDLSKINHKLVMASVTPFGQTGPYKNYKGSDLVTMAMGGYMQITGNPDHAPLRLGNEHSHYPGSQYLAVGITGALYYRDFVSSKGQHIDVSQVEATIPYHIEQHQAMMWHFTGQNVVRAGLQSQVGVPLGVFPAKDGWIAVLTVAAQEWDNLSQWVFEVTGEKTILDESLKGAVGQGRRQRFEEVNGYITAFTTQVNRNELFHDGQQKRGVPLHPVNTVEDLLNDTHLKASDFWMELDHPVVGKLKYPKRGPFDGEDVPALRKAAPLLGEHNKEIYCGELGLTQKDLALLRSAGII